MDPFTIALAGVGIATSIFGAFGSSQVAAEKAKVSSDIATQEQSQNAQRKQQMELQAQRQQLENARNTQRARAMGLNAAVNQGAQMGSGLQGGQAEATDKGGYNALNIAQNLNIGENIFALDDKISADKMKLAQLGGDEAKYAGISNVGNSIFKASGTVGNIFKGSFGGGSSGNGDYSGMPWSANTGGLY